MKYVGSKNRLSKDLAPIIQKYIDDNNIKNYLEPFVGGANMIDKIQCENKYGSDSQPYLVALLKQAQKDTSVFPNTITEDEYNHIKKHYKDKDFNEPNWFVGLVGFCSFGAKFFDSFPRGYKADKITPRDMPNEAFRNIIKQSSKLKNIKFTCCNFNEINDNIKNFVIYCDPPYKNTVRYSTGDFPYDDFYNWCKKMSKNNIVLISEYNMPNDFECIWQKELICSLNNVSGKSDNRIERLYICK